MNDQTPQGFEKLPDEPPAQEEISFKTAIRRNMARHAGLYVICSLLGLQAFFTGFYDNFWPIEPEQMAKLGSWQVLAALFKSLSFALGIAVGYILKPSEPAK